jgi:hypothetical protein
MVVPLPESVTDNAWGAVQSDAADHTAAEAHSMSANSYGADGAHMRGK